MSSQTADGAPRRNLTGRWAVVGEFHPAMELLADVGNGCWVAQRAEDGVANSYTNLEEHVSARRRTINRMRHVRWLGFWTWDSGVGRYTHIRRLTCGRRAIGGVFREGLDHGKDGGNAGRCW